MNLPQNPCVKCEERHMHCHAECERYKTYYASKRQYNVEKKRKDQIYDYRADAKTKKERKRRNHNKF